MNVIWSNRASFKYEEVLSYLIENWTIKDAQHLVQLTSSIIKKIQKNPSLFKISSRYNYLRKGKVTKHNSIIYQVDENEYTHCGTLNERERGFRLVTPIFIIQTYYFF